MRAAIFNGKQNLNIKEVPNPQPRENEVLIKVKATGICGTDRHIFAGKAPAKPPMIPGHEIAGQVIKVGEDVTTICNGDKVVIDPNIFCNKCFYCQRGEIHLCENLEAIGVTKNGGFATYVVVPVTNVYKLPNNLSYESGAMIEPLSCCLHGIDLAGIRTGDLVVILGGGAIGLINGQLALLAGARKVIISEPSRYKREIAQKIGLVDAVRPDKLNDIIDTTSRGADIVIEAVGKAETITQAFKVVRNGGTIVLFGVCPDDLKLSISPFDIYKKELTIKGSYINPFVTDRAISVLSSNRIKIEELITNRYSLEKLPKILSDDPLIESIKSLIIFD